MSTAEYLLIRSSWLPPSASEGAKRITMEKTRPWRKKSLQAYISRSIPLPSHHHPTRTKTLKANTIKQTQHHRDQKARPLCRRKPLANIPRTTPPQTKTRKTRQPSKKKKKQQQRLKTQTTRSQPASSQRPPTTPPAPLPTKKNPPNTA